MSMHVRVSGTWREVTGLHVRVGGTWRSCSEGHVRVSGTWQQFFGSDATVSPASTNVSHTIDFTCYAQMQYQSGGNEYHNTGGTNNYSTSRGAWLDSGSAGSCYIEYSLNSGSSLWSAPAGRVVMSTTRSYRQRDTNSSAASVTSNITTKIYNASSGGTLLGSATFSLTANYFNACPLCCFVPGTLITMAGGEQKKIEEIRPGDEIVVYDPDWGVFKTEEVTELLTRVGRTMYRITFEDGTVLHASDDHPLHVPDKGPSSIIIQPAYKHMYETKELKVGDFVTCIKASWWRGHDVEKIVKIEYAPYDDVVYTLGNSYFFANNKLVY